MKLGVLIVAFTVSVFAAADIIFIDPSATGAGNGTSMADAYTNWETGLETSKSSTDTTFYLGRRTGDQTFSTSIIPVISSTWQSKPVIISGWPRNEKTGTGNFVQGSNVVSGVSFTTDMRREGARLISCDADGYQYLITAVAVKIVLSATTTEFDRLHTVTGGTSGAVGKIMRWTTAGSDTMWVVVKPGTGPFQSSENITSDGSGDGTIGTVTEGDGYVLLNDYSGTTSVNGAFTIEKDPYYDRCQEIVDAEKTNWNADSDSLPLLTFTGTTQFRASPYSTTLQCISFVGGGGSNSGNILMSSLCGLCQNVIDYTNSASGAYGIHFNALGVGTVKNTVVIGQGATSASCFKIENPLVNMINCSGYNSGQYGAILLSNVTMRNVALGYELNNTQDDISVQSGNCYGYNLRCGGGSSKVRTASYDSYNQHLYAENWDMVLGRHVHKLSNGWAYYINVDGGTDPVQRSGGGSTVIRLKQNESANYRGKNDEVSQVIFERDIWVEAGTDTIIMYIQDSACGDINISDDVGNRTIWLEADYPAQYVNDSVYSIGQIDIQGFSHHSTSSTNPISNRASSSDWDSYVKLVCTVARAGNIKLRCKTAFYHATGTLFIDPKLYINSAE